jgi:steroid 5-alpha reductase family enzyme
VAKGQTRAVRMTVISIILGGLLAWAGSQGSAQWQGIPVFAMCVLLAFAVQWIVYLPSYFKQTEHFYDLTGSLTYLSVIACVWILGGELDLRGKILAALVVIWALRLGTFLFIRISKDGSDRRFDQIKPNPVRFLAAWTVQGLWVSVTAAAALAAMLASDKASLGLIGMAGIALWIIGFALEVIADHQKRVFRAEREKTGHAFIHTGLWAYSRHPNYFGEILLWAGVSLVALPVLSGWTYVTLISPVFVFVLLTRISGIPTLEKSADRRLQGNPAYKAYKAYKAQTPVLFPRLSKPAALQESQA